MKFLFPLLAVLVSTNVLAADFTVQLTPAAGSVGNTEVSSILSTKISDWSTAFASLFASTIKGPTQQVFRTPTGSTPLTYTKPAGVLYIRVVMVGAGGGGCGSGTSAGSLATAGGQTVFGSVLTANGGGAGGFNVDGGLGGSSTIGAGATGISLSGGQGAGSPSANNNYQNVPGGIGGASAFGGAGNSNYNRAGYSAAAYTGSGGGGGGTYNQTSGNAGAGGGAGGYVNAIILNPLPSYTFLVGGGGPGGGNGPGGAAGGAGAGGFIEVTEYYQ